MSDETPNGCLSCNTEEIKAFFGSKNVDLAMFKLVAKESTDTLPPCPKCGSIYRVSHSIDEDWVWVVREKSGGDKEIIGVQYPNGDSKMAVDMPPQQWRAYLKKGHLKADSRGRLSVLNSAYTNKPS